MKLKLLLIMLFFMMLTSCKVAFITGYDFIIDETATKLKRDFNVVFIKLSRNFKTQDNNVDQSFINYQDYYDNMEADIKVLQDRTVTLPKKSEIVKKEVDNIKTLLLDFESRHKNQGFKDSQIDDHRDDLNGINKAIDALILLQEKLKTTGK